MDKREIAAWLANVDSNGASDEEFAETMALAYYMWKEGKSDIELTKDMMNDLDTNDLCENLKKMLDDIISSAETDSGCWWKEADNDNKVALNTVKIIIKYINWDVTDNGRTKKEEKEILKDLPKSLTLEANDIIDENILDEIYDGDIDEYLNDNIADWLSDNYDFCVNSCDYELVE